MNKDDHLIYESLVQSRAPMSDEQAAKMITDKIKGTPNLNIQNIKMYVQKYLGLVGKAPSDVDFIAAMVHDNLQNMGMGENAEDAEGMSDQEYHKARKDAFEGAGEELGHGPIKLQLMRDQKFDCYKSGTAQEVEFVKGTIFNCEDAQSDYYHCETEEYGTIAVFPEGMKRLSREENAENADAKKERVQRGWQMNKDRWAKWKKENPEAAAKHAAKKQGKSAENAENVPHGYPQGITAIQNTLINQLKKHGFKLTKIHHADKDRDAYPTVYMMRSVGPMHSVAEIDGMGQINDEPYAQYLHDLKHDAEEAEGRSNAQHAAIAIALQKAGKKPS